jgi:parallel beta-helix repeat protein
MSRYCAGAGFRFANTGGSGTQIENITLENCYSRRNKGMGFYLERSENQRLIGCGAEKNNDTNVYVDSTVDGFEWQGGYTEKANNNHVSPPGSYVDNEAWVFEAGVKDVKVLGGRLFGRFKYTTNSEFLIHSYGHTVQGFDGSNDPTNNTVSPPEANYQPTPEQLAAVLNLNPSYYELPEYFRYFSGMSVYGTTCTSKTTWQTALKNKLNIYLVLHAEGDQTSTITTAITNAVNASNAYSGILAFEPGQTYETKPFVVDGRVGTVSLVDTTRGGHGIRFDGTVQGGEFHDIYYGMFDSVRSHHNGSESSNINATGILFDGSDEDGVRIANVRVYRSNFDFNTEHGIYQKKTSMTFVDTSAKGNADYGIRAGVMRSANFVNCRIAGGYDSSTEVRLMHASENYDNENGIGTLPGWAGGFHFLGGHIREADSGTLAPWTTTT